MIGCFDRAFLLAGAFSVRCVKNRMDSIVAFFYAMTACDSCVTCACVLLFFCCLRNFIAFIAFLAHFLFCLRTFSYARPRVRCVRLNGNGLQSINNLLCVCVKCLNAVPPLPPNPCAINNGGCCSNADCIPTPYGDNACKCKPGFIGDGHVCKRKH